MASFAGDATIRVDGLKELGRALKQLEDGLQKEIPRALKPIADRVADKAKSRINSKTGRLAASIRPYATQRAAGVRMGSKAVAYAGPVEFGGYPKGRPYIKEGRAIYPTFVEEAPRFEREMVEALSGLIRRTGL